MIIPLRAVAMTLMAVARRLKHRALVMRKALSSDGRTRGRLSRAGVKLDASVYVHPAARVAPGATIGPRSWVNEDARIDSLCTIGSDVGVGPGVRLVCATHEAGTPLRRAGATQRQPVRIGDGCWLGAGVIVLPGVTVAPGCVVGAGAVVVRDTQENGLYVGVPARRVRNL